MRWNRGSTRWAGFANRPPGRIAHSNRPRPSETPKLISAGWVSTPSSASRRREAGVVAVVEHDEPRIHLQATLAVRDRDRVDVSADTLGGLEHSHLVARRMEVASRHEAGDPRADDGDAGHQDRLPAGIACGRCDRLSELDELIPQPLPLSLGLAGPRKAVLGPRGPIVEEAAGVLAGRGAANQPHGRVGARRGIAQERPDQPVEAGQRALEAGRVHPARMHRCHADPVVAPAFGEQAREHDLDPLGVRVHARPVEPAPHGLEVVDPKPARVHAPRSVEDHAPPGGQRRAQQPGEQEGTEDVGREGQLVSLRAESALRGQDPRVVHDRDRSRAPPPPARPRAGAPRRGRRGRSATGAAHRSPAAGMRRRSSATASEARSRLRATTCTVAPSTARASQIAKPMPDAPPVTTTCLSTSAAGVTSSRHQRRRSATPAEVYPGTTERSRSVSRREEISGDSIWPVMGICKVFVQILSRLTRASLAARLKPVKCLYRVIPRRTHRIADERETLPHAPLRSRDASGSVSSAAARVSPWTPCARGSVATAFSTPRARREASACTGPRTSGRCAQ